MNNQNEFFDEFDLDPSILLESENLNVSTDILESENLNSHYINQPEVSNVVSYIEPIKDKVSQEQLNQDLELIKQINSLRVTDQKPKDKLLEESFINMIIYEMQKSTEMDINLDAIEKEMNDPDIQDSLSIKDKMNWYKLSSDRKNQSRMFLMKFYEAVSKNEVVASIFSKMTGQEVSYEELKQDDKTKTAKAVLQKILMDRVKES